MPERDFAIAWTFYVRVDSLIYKNILCPSVTLQALGLFMFV